MRVACIFNHSNTGTGDFVSGNFAIHDFSNVIYHNGASRTITNTASIPGNSTSFTAADCSGLVGASPNNWVNRAITKTTGTGNVKAYTTALSFVTTVAPQCTVTLSKSTGAAAIPAGSIFKVENSDVRAVDDGTVDVAPAANITSTEANFQATDVGCSVSGTNFVDGTTISAVISPTQANTSPAPVSYAAPNNLPTAPTAVVTICGTKEVNNNRQVNDASTNVGGTQIISSAAKFSAASATPGISTTADIGMRVTGTGITQPCYIVSRVNGTTVNLSSACALGILPNTQVAIGEPSATAVTDGDVVLNQGAMLPLDPGLVKGSHDCSEDEMSGFGIEGTWRSPGNYVPPSPPFSLPASQPTGTKTVGQILFHTSVVDFAAYIVEVPALTGTDPISAPHFNVVFPSSPVNLALCATATSPGLALSIGVNGTTVSQSGLAAGTGRPGTSQLRSTRASTTGSTSTIYITDTLGDAGVKWTGSEFNRLCPVPAGKPDIVPPPPPPAVGGGAFLCGDG